MVCGPKRWFLQNKDHGIGETFNIDDQVAQEYALVMT